MKILLSIINYLGAAMLLLLCYLGGIILFPIAYLFRNSPYAKKYPLWWWFDDEDGLYGAEYWRIAKKIIKKNFWVAWRWSIRNPMWNAHTKLVPGSGLELIKYSAGKLKHKGKEVNLINSAVFNYVNDNGVWSGNVGEYLSGYYSYLGWSFIYFEKSNGRTYWRFSLAKQIIGDLGIEIQIGTFHRYIFKIKLKWNNKIFERDCPISCTPVNVINNFKTVVLPMRDYFSEKISKFIINF